MKFQHEEESYYKVLKYEFKKKGISYSHRKGDVLCYKASDADEALDIVMKEIPSIIPGPGYVQLSETKYADRFKELLDQNGINAKEATRNGKVIIYWKGDHVMAINNAVASIRKEIASEIKSRANKL